jgi:hypothetical protein
VKTSSQYVSASSATSQNSQFKGFFNTQDFHKATQELNAAANSATK